MARQVQVRPRVRRADDDEVVTAGSSWTSVYADGSAEAMLARAYRLRRRRAQRRGAAVRTAALLR